MVTDLGFTIGITLVVVGCILTLTGLVLCCVLKGKTYTPEDMERFLDHQIDKTIRDQRRRRLENTFVPGKKLPYSIMAS